MISDPPNDKELRREAAPAQGGPDQLVYVLSERATANSIRNDIVDFNKLVRILWQGKSRIMAATILFAIAALLYALLADEWYRAEVVLIPSEEKSMNSLDGQLGGLAVLAGVNVGGGDSTEAIAVLRSREFAQSFIADMNLVPVFFVDEWLAEEERWLDKDPTEWPDLRDAVKYFHDHILRVSQDRQTRLVTVAVEWKDATLAAAWADALVERLNARLRQRALTEAQRNVSYLERELIKTNVVTLQHSIGRLLESELHKLMLARGSDEYSFRVIDSPGAPKESVRPKRTVIVLLGVFFGAFIGLFWVFGLHILRANPDRQ